MRNPKRLFIKTYNIITAEGLFVFFRKAVRRLYWEIVSKCSSRFSTSNITCRQRMNQITKNLLVKKLPTALIDQNDKSLFVLIDGFKKEMVDISQKEKSY